MTDISILARIVKTVFKTMPAAIYSYEIPTEVIDNPLNVLPPLHV